MSLERRLLDALAPWRDAAAWYVGFSGGLDSSVLLHLLAAVREREALPPLHALHVHHGLQAVADQWPAQCARLCAELKVPLEVLRVQVADEASVEQAARRARYAAFAQRLEPGACLLTAQHRDDQAETLLLRLLRGAGVRGLASMPSQRTLGAGHLLRPLLTVPRSELEAYAQAHRLSWVEDPSNDDPAFARNYLRHRVMPVLTEQWPQAAACLARSAEHLAEAEQLLGELAEQDLHAARTLNDCTWLALPSLEVAVLSRLSEARQRNALRHWLAPLTAMPDSDHWAGWQDLRDASVDAEPVWRLNGGELRRSRGRVWWLGGDWLREPAPLDGVGPVTEQIMPLPGNGHLSLTGRPPVGPLHLAYRQGGETLALAGRGHRDLKRLLAESDLPAFVRGRLPLLWRGDELLGVANCPGLRGAGEQGWELHWSPPTSDSGLS
ncbi:MAG: tRNA(Ile)-lysidine synthase [Pseudomonas delhiensis]|nr:MAG: tRNA(Ile)-lysidine synthase [Pseudomonas delhiensis]